MNPLLRAVAALGAGALAAKAINANQGERAPRYGIAILIAFGVWLAAPTILGDGKPM